MFDIEAFIKLEGDIHLFRGLVAQLDITLLPPEQVRADRDIALRRQTVANLSHAGIDAEDFLAHHDAWRAGVMLRARDISVKKLVVEGVNLDGSHESQQLYGYGRA